MERTRLGLIAALDRVIAGRPALHHTLMRVAAVPLVERIVLVHPARQDVRGLVTGTAFAKPIEFFADPAGLRDPHASTTLAARAWALHSWRGGLGNATCYDELLPAAPLHRAAAAHGAEVVLLVGGDWVLVDPALCQRVIERHLEAPEQMQMTFTQAPPGLCGVALGANLLEQLAQTPGSTIGQTLAYVPSRPQADPIGKDVCVQVSAQVRSCARRFIDDTPRSRILIDALAARLGDRLMDSDANAIAAAVNEVEHDPSHIPAVPQQVTLELTPERAVSGPIVPQFHAKLGRAPMDIARAVAIIEQLGAAGDVALTLGGLGDALLHPDFDTLITAAKRAGVLGVCIETDLLVDEPTLDRLLRSPVDVVVVRVNADREATYKKTMGTEGLKRVIDNLQYLYRERSKIGATLPWLVPSMIKTADTLPDMESFYDRWVHYLGHAVVEGAKSGCGLMPEMSPVAMTPPRRRPCRQVNERMTIHSDGRVARCDQDWQGRAAAGDTARASLAEIWSSMQQVRTAHDQGRGQELELCGACTEWHRP
ncbi:MAG: SPASM domain-containing protein [Planctomycetes bacterium]|nr:SPASM domain-containing protein [Planctomycetota bacterium]